MTTHIPARWATVELGECNVDVPTDPNQFVTWYLRHMVILIGGLHSIKVACAILRQTFTYRLDRYDVRRAYFGSAFDELAQAREQYSRFDELALYRNLALIDIHGLTENLSLLLANLLRRRRNDGRVTIVTASSLNALLIPDDLDLTMVKA